MPSYSATADSELTRTKCSRIQFFSADVFFVFVLKKNVKDILYSPHTPRQNTS